jgi:hypothetical protein
VVLTLALFFALSDPQEKTPPAIVLPLQPSQVSPLAKDSEPKKPVGDVGIQGAAIFNITKHIPARYNPSRVPRNGSWAGGQQQDIRQGGMTFSVQNSTWQGKTCKLFKAQSNWDYRPDIRNKKITFTPKLYVFAQISLEGRLLHMNTAYNGFGAPVQIDATFKADSIDIAKTEGRKISKTTLFPTFSMSLFDNLFDPFIRDGLVVANERQLAFLHPVTGAPCVVKATLNGRFNGKHEFREYHGYKIDVTSPDTMAKAVSMVSRHGQLLQVNLPAMHDAISYTHVSGQEERNWGTFKPSDWEVPASISQPNRTRHRTMGVPVLLTNPSYMLFPIPFAVAL